MKVEQIDTDYDVFLTERDLRQTCSRTSVPWSVFPQHPPVSAKYIDNRGEAKELELEATNDYMILRDPQSHDDIFFDMDEFGPVVRVFTNLLMDLLEGEQDFLVTRYDGHEAKIWIRKDEALAKNN